MRGVFEKYREGIFWSTVYIACCLVVANLPSPAYQCDYQNPNTEQRCHHHDPELVQSLLVEGIQSVGKWDHDDWIAAGTIIIAIFTIVLGIGTVFIVRDGREHSRRELRAYVTASPVMIHFTDERPWSYRVSVRNCGQTPAYKLEVWARVGPKPYPVRPDEVFSNGKPEARVTLAHNIDNFGVGEAFSRGLNSDERAALLRGTLGVYIWGEAVYYDIFGDFHRTPFRYVYGGKFVGTEEMEMCAEGNDAS